MARKEKPYNNGTMTKAGFFGWIRSALRDRSRYWKPVAEAKKRARRPFVGEGRQKWEYQCNSCKRWFPDKEVAIDHIEPAGSLNDFSDLPDFTKRLFCEVEGLQCLCKNCHDVKTKEEKASRKN
jgi:hypothetical protein